MKMNDIFSLCHITREGIIISVQFTFVSLSINFLCSTWRLSSELNQVRRQYQNFCRHIPQNSRNLEGNWVVTMKLDRIRMKEKNGIQRMNETERVVRVIRMV